jgi:hypothetical protein
MQELVIRFSVWLKFLFKTLESRVKILIQSKNSSKFCEQKSDNTEFVILGNGPSLSSVILENRDFLEGKELICVNHFPVTDFYTELKPAYYLTIAYDLFLDDIDPKFVEASNRLFNAMVEKTTWKLKFFILREAEKYDRWKNIINKNKNIEIIYMNVTPVEGFRKFMFRQFDKANGMPRPHNILIPSIFTAIHLGARKIYLIGAEHSWLRELHVDENNHAYLFNQHFYDPGKNPERFNYKGQSYMKLHEILKSFSIIFENYHILKEYADYKNVEIINCTKNSFIDAFKRQEIKNN